MQKLALLIVCFLTTLSFSVATLATTVEDVQSTLGTGNGIYFDGGNDENNNGPYTSSWTTPSNLTADWNTAASIFGEDPTGRNDGVGGDILDSNPNSSGDRIAEIRIHVNNLLPNQGYDLWFVGMENASSEVNHDFAWGLASGALTAEVFNEAIDTHISGDLYGTKVAVVQTDISGALVLYLNDNGDTARTLIDGILVDQVVPEPASLALLGLGGITLLNRRQRIASHL